MTANKKGRPNESSPKQFDAPDSTRRTLLESIAEQYPGTRGEAQRARILAALSHGALTTIEARRWLDCPHPAQRISQLKGMGVGIVTHRTVAPSECGALHRFAAYVLIARGPVGKVHGVAQHGGEVL